MRQVFNHIIFILVASILATSCVSLQPTASSISDADYNQRVEINNPKYKKKHNAIGFTFDVGMPLAGAAVGYATDPFVRQTDEGQKSFRAGGAILGAIVGSGLTYASHAIQKYGSNTSVKNQRTWVDKAFGSHYYILEASGNYLRIINSNAEKNYIVKNLLDIKDFANAFPSSLYSDQIVAQAIEKLERDNLPTILQLFPHTVHAQKLKDKYLNDSPTFQQLISALQKYPKPASEVENLFVNLVRTPLDAVDFHQRYPKSSHNKQVIINAFHTNPNADDVRKLANAYGNTFYLSQSDLSNVSDKIKRNYYIGVCGMTNFSNMSQLDRFNEKYSWLTFKDKKYEMACKIWDLANRLYPKGKDVISQAGKIVDKTYAKKVGLDGNYFNGFVNEMLKQQFEKLKLISTKTMSSSSDEFERWKKSAYSAGLVKTEGKLQFLVYGELKNESKFDFPVVMRVFSSVSQVQKIENGGLLGGVINILGALANAPTEHVEVLGTLASKEYIIPCAMSGQTMPYAILIEFEDKVFNGVSGGVNFLDLMKVSSQIVLNNPTVKMDICDKNPTREQLSEQNAWLKMAINGLPQAKTIDWFRNQEYKQSTWDAEWSRILRESKNRSYSSTIKNEEKDNYSDDNSEEELTPEDEDDNKTETILYTCRIKLYYKDNSPVCLENVEVTFDSDAWKKVRTDEDGNLIVQWNKDYGKRIVGLSFVKGVIYTTPYSIKNLSIEDGESCNLNVDALNSN